MRSRSVAGKRCRWHSPTGWDRGSSGIFRSDDDLLLCGSRRPPRPSFPGRCFRPRQPRDVVRDRSTGLAPVAGPDHLRSIRRWRGVGLAVVVALGIASHGDTPDLATPVDPERDNLLVEWRIAGAPDHL